MPMFNALWTEQEDIALRKLVDEFGPKKWSLIASKLKTKGSKQCRRRWKNFLNADLKKGGWTSEEDRILVEGHKKYGNKWTEIAKLVGGRTDNAVKNRWAALCKRSQKTARQGVRGRRPKAQSSTSTEDSDSDGSVPTSQPAPAVLSSRPAAPTVAAAEPSRAAQQNGSLKRSPRLAGVPVAQEPPAKRSRLQAVTNGATLDTPRTPRTPRLLAQAEENIARQASAQSEQSSRELVVVPNTANSPKALSPGMSKKPDLSICIPQPASADPQLAHNKALEICVFKDLLTPCEVQYAHELNDMDVPLHIKVEDDPPLSTSRMRTEDALTALVSPGTAQGFEDFLNIFKSGFTPRPGGAGGASGSIFGSTPKLPPLPTRSSPRKPNRTSNTPRFAAALLQQQQQQQQQQQASLVPLNGSASTSNSSGQPALAGLGPGRSLLGGGATSSATTSNGSGSVNSPRELHQGHLALLNKLITGAKEQEVGMGLGSQPSSQPSSGPGPSRLSIPGFGRMERPSRLITPNSPARQQLPGAKGLGGCSPAFPMVNSRGLPHADIVMTPNFSAAELNMLLDALNADDNVMGLPPAPLPL